MGDLGGSIGRSNDRNDVNPEWGMPELATARDVRLRCADEVLLFRACHRLRRRSERERAPRLHFHEYNLSSFSAHEIEFPDARANITSKNRISLFAKIRRRKTFTRGAETRTSVRHRKNT